MAAEATTRKKRGRGGVVPASAVDFTAAAHEHVEGPFLDQTVVPGAAAQVLNPVDVPAYGFLRHVVLDVRATGGTIGTPTLDDDFPFNVLSEVSLLDVNGAPIVQLSGYDLFLANVFGGYAFHSDPRRHPDYSAATAISFGFMLRIPVEINHNNGLGALANQNAAAPYRLRVGVNSTAMYDVAPTLAPNVRVRAYLEAWSQPPATDQHGRPQQQLPPRHGTTQYWSSVKGIATTAGAQTLRVNRVGNLIRNLIVVGRGATDDRTNATIPDPITIRWDARELLREPQVLRRAYATERNSLDYSGALPNLPAGVFPYQFTHDVLGHAGDGTPELYIPTLQNSRLEIDGTFGAGVVDIITNDVAPVEVDPAERFDQESETGFTPEVGVPVR